MTFIERTGCVSEKAENAKKKALWFYISLNASRDICGLESLESLKARVKKKKKIGSINTIDIKDSVHECITGDVFL